MPKGRAPGPAGAKPRYSYAPDLRRNTSPMRPAKLKIKAVVNGGPMKPRERVQRGLTSDSSTAGYPQPVDVLSPPRRG